MRKLLVLLLLVCFGTITYLYNLIGLVIALVVFGGIYYVINIKFSDKKALPEKGAFASTFVLTYLAVIKEAENPSITAVAFIFLVVLLIMLLTMYKDK